MSWPRLSLLASILTVLIGTLLGLGAYTFYYAEGLSYMSNDPAVCTNCHIMNDELASYSKSGHHHVAVCNDCHLPHFLPSKLLAKARNGYNHSKAFTLQDFHEPILIGPKNAEILQENCVRCHENLVHDAILVPAGGAQEAQLCIHCHRNVGHAPIH